MPSKPVLYNRSTRAVTMRSQIFTDLGIDTVIDMSPVRRETFGAAISPSCLIIGTSSNFNSGPVLYLSPRRTPLASAIGEVVISQENIHRVDRSVAIGNPSIWKTLLWGSRDDVALVRRLRETIPPLSATINSRKWVKGQGFQEVGADRRDSEFLVGMPLIDTESVNGSPMSSDGLSEVVARVMHRPRNVRLYQAPHLLLRKGFSERPLVGFADFDAAFTDGLFGIAGDAEDTADLRYVAAVLSSSLAHYWLLMSSSSWGVEREQIFPNEFLEIPLKWSTGRASAAVLEAYSDTSGLNRQTRLDRAVYEAYELNEHEIDLITDALDYYLSEHRDGPNSRSYGTTVASERIEYCELLEHALRGASSIEWSVSVDTVDSGFVVVSCSTGAAGDGSRRVSPEAAAIERLFSTEQAAHLLDPSPSTLIQPSLLVLADRAVLLVKPDQRRSWSRSRARLDATDVLSAVLLSDLDRVP